MPALRLLIAEDELDLAEVLTAFLEKNQYAVDTVHDGADALDYAATGEYDAIILDIMMPKLDGLSVLTRLRSANVSTPVMLLTARGEKDDRVAGFNTGADDYLPKPQMVLSAERIMERVWGWDTEAEINVVWVHISNLRKKLSAAGSTVSIRASRCSFCWTMRSNMRTVAAVSASVWRTVKRASCSAPPIPAPDWTQRSWISFLIAL